MKEDDLKQYLLNNFDCYTVFNAGFNNMEEEPAITIPKFIEIIKSLDPNFIINE